MKKITTVLLAVLLAVLVLGGCGKGKKSQATVDVETMIEAISDDITPETGKALEAARAAYEALPEEEQPRMNKLKRLQKLEADFAEFDSVKRYVEEVAEIAAGRFTKESKFTELLDRADEIRQSYKKLPKDQKEQIVGMDKLDDNLKALEEHVANAKAAATTYVQAFLKLNEKNAYTVSAVYCNNQIGLDGEDLYICALTYRDKSGAETTVYSNARFGANATAGVLMTRAEYFYSETVPAGEDNDPVTNGNVALDAAEIVAAAQATLSEVKVPVTTQPAPAEETTAAPAAEPAQTTAAPAETTTAAA